MPLRPQSAVPIVANIAIPVTLILLVLLAGGLGFLFLLIGAVILFRKLSGSE